MKILYVSTNKGIQNGASISYLETLSLLLKNNIEVIATVPGNGAMATKIKELGVKIYQIDECEWVWNIDDKYQIDIKRKIKYIVRKLQNKLSINKLCKIVKDEKIDLIHINAITAYVAAETARRCKIPYIYHIREFLNEDLNQHFYNEEYSKELINSASKQICISNSIKDKYENKYNINKIIVIYNGVNIDKYFCDREIFKKEITNICILGRQAKAKGQLEFLEAIKELLKENKNIHCEIVGSDYDKEYSNKLFQFVKDNKINDYVNIKSHIDNPEDYLKKQDIVCVCSYYEAFGRITIEAMLSGALVIGNDSACTSELIDNNKHGYLYKENDSNDLYKKLLYAINNKEEAKLIAKKGQVFAKDFSIENNVNKLIKVYKECAY